MLVPLWSWCAKAEPFTHCTIPLKEFSDSAMEITRPSGLFVDVTYEAIPILPEGKLLCDEFGLDP
jgi:hypothetical protein